MKVAAKREDIVQAALEIISHQGFHGSPISAIAAQAGVAAGTIYRYFESKEVLITELRKALEGEINAEVLKDYPVGRPLRERFLHLFRGVLRHFIAFPLHFRYLEQYFNSPYGITLHREKLLGNAQDRDLLMELFDEGLRERVLKALPRTALLALSMGPMIVLMRDHILGFAVLDEKLVAQITEASWDAIKR